MNNEKKLELLGKFSEEQLAQLAAMIGAAANGGSVQQHRELVDKGRELLLFGKNDEVVYEGGNYRITSVSKKKKTANLVRGDEPLVKGIGWENLTHFEDSIEEEEEEEERGDEFVMSNSLTSKRSGVQMNVVGGGAIIKDDMVEDLDDIKTDKLLSVQPPSKRGVRRTGQFEEVVCVGCQKKASVSPVLLTGKDYYKCNSCILNRV